MRRVKQELRCSTLEKLTYELPVTQAAQIEVAIAEKLKPPISTVRKLISYQIKN